MDFKRMAGAAISVYFRSRAWLLVMYLLGCLLVGHRLVGPIVYSEVFDRIVRLSRSNPVVGVVFDLESMVLDSLIAASVPFFMAWSVVLFAYSLDKSSAEFLNAKSRYVGPLTGGIAAIWLALGMIILGVATFGYMANGTNMTSTYFVGTSVLLLAIGWFFKILGIPSINPNPRISCLAPYLAAVLGLAAVFAYVYGVLSKPRLLWSIFREAYSAS